MNETEKLLKKLNSSTRNQIERTLLKIYANQLDGLDIKALKGSKGVYRVRVGRYRIIYRQIAAKNELISIGLRNEKTYKNL